MSHQTLQSDPDCDVLVRRSRLDPDVWVCTTENGFGHDQSDSQYPGRLRAVKRYAESVYGFGDPVRWFRRNPDTWEMQFV